MSILESPVRSLVVAAHLLLSMPGCGPHLPVFTAALTPAAVADTSLRSPCTCRNAVAATVPSSLRPHPHLQPISFAASAAARGGGVATRSGAAQVSSGGSRDAEFQSIIDAATDRTATVGDDETCAGKTGGEKWRERRAKNENWYTYRGHLQSERRAA